MQQRAAFSFFKYKEHDAFEQKRVIDNIDVIDKYFAINLEKLNFAFGVHPGSVNAPAATENFITEFVIKLPELNLSIFDGIYSKWTEFKDIFKLMINDNLRL